MCVIAAAIKFCKILAKNFYNIFPVDFEIYPRYFKMVMERGGARVGAGRKRKRNKRVTVSLTPGTVQRIKDAVRAEDREQIGWWIERAVLYYLER